VVITIPKQRKPQRYIFKIHSARLRRAKWKLSLTLAEARANDEIVSLADSQILRFIDDINDVEDNAASVGSVRREIRTIRKQEPSHKTATQIRDLYAELDRIQFQKDYMCLIIDKEKDYYRACKGFCINGIRYVRLLGTSGGIKNSTIVFVSETVHDELQRRIDNGRDKTKEFVPAKLEAYQALVCSGSTPVSMPRGIAVVSDCMTTFTEDVVVLNDEAPGEPVITYTAGAEIELDASDGYGLMLPSLAERWSEELELGYTMSGCNSRMAFEKGMIYTFDFQEFADDVAHSRTITDAWGNTVDISNVELILTTSMVKLWDSYSSCAEYVNNSIENGYSFSIAKVCPETLENVHSLNYQFIQSYDMTDEDIDELIAPTMETFRNVLGDDWRQAVLFMGGGNNEDMYSPERLYESSAGTDIVKALLVCPEIINDSFVYKKIFNTIKNKINEAKIGVIDVHGNYSMISGDPYSLCQHAFGLPVTGLLKAGEIYNEYWAAEEADELVCFRAPMTCHANIRRVQPCRRDDVRHWFRYIHTGTCMNSWDTMTSALNGCDFDGDTVMLTDNPVLVRCHKPQPTLMCAQRKATKCVPTEEDMIKSNIASFGDDIGKITNRATSMFNVRSKFPADSPEYKELEYRIQCCQQLQQNAIDRAKGIVCKPMPRSWYDPHFAPDALVAEEKKYMYPIIVADHKPYFMIYIYPQIKKKYSAYIDNINKKAIREFRKTLDELKNADPAALTNREREFLDNYTRGIPVGMGNCTMNRICDRFEKEFDGFVGKKKGSGFNTALMKSDVAYGSYQYYAVKRLYGIYNKKNYEYLCSAKGKRQTDEDRMQWRMKIAEAFRRECALVCTNSKQLCNIVVDMCYGKDSSKQFAWDVAGNEIISNLLANTGGRIWAPHRDEDGDVVFRGERYSFDTREVNIDGDNLT